MEFVHWDKIPRASNTNCCITEKIDGTNGVIAIGTGPFDGDPLDMQVGSRNRWIEPGKDNYGFAAWAYEHKDLLLRLGPGYHHGEWYGAGIQRGYGLAVRRFALFNAGRWSEDELRERGLYGLVEAVPTLAICTLDKLGETLPVVEKYLREEGSVAVPGWEKPEGYVVRIGDARFKVTDAKSGNKLQNAMELFKAAIPDKALSEVAVQAS